ncbi:putative glycolipid-binding domain-containing protein [Rhodococcoides kroppenstedtii]|uniref:putative glycolipid-binding domain-containing protein n=1 Tax=Rhodococcoides kroppenstedtii TaxID=293050 RepID=UPI0027E2BF02|nr:putative glycolipid-binding domain-containing protein [Rhodococcus kroppenstedtii]
MTTPAPTSLSSADVSGSSWPAVLTWRALEAPRMESVRVQINGKRIKAAGRIIAGACDEHPAFSASYDLVTDESGVTKRLSVRSAVAAGESQISISRDSQGFWLIDSASPTRSDFDGALDTELVWSPFFNTLAIRRLGLHSGDASDQQVPVVYVGLPDLTARAETLSYRGGPTEFEVDSPMGHSKVTVDSEGFVIGYDGMAHRI